MMKHPSKIRGHLPDRNKLRSPKASLEIAGICPKPAASSLFDSIVLRANYRFSTYLKREDVRYILFFRFCLWSVWALCRHGPSRSLGSPAVGSFLRCISQRVTLFRVSITCLDRPATGRGGSYPTRIYCTETSLAISNRNFSFALQLF